MVLVKLAIKIMVLLAALVALGFGIALLFFYENFQYLNELTNTAYFTKKKGYKKGGDYLFDSWVMGWRLGFGLIALLAGVWLFSIFISYWSI